MRRVDKERGNIRRVHTKEWKHDKRVSFSRKRNEKQKYKNVDDQNAILNREIFLLARNTRKRDNISRENKRVCFEQWLKTQRMRQKKRDICGKRSKQKEKWQNETSMKQTYFWEKKVKWIHDKKIHRRKERKRRIIKDATKEMKDKWRKTVKKKKINGGEKNNRTKEEKQEVRNKEAFTQKNEAKATRQDRHKHRKEHRKIIDCYGQEEVKTNEISDKRGEWQNEIKENGKKKNEIKKQEMDKREMKKKARKEKREKKKEIKVKRRDEKQSIGEQGEREKLRKSREKWEVKVFFKRTKKGRPW